MKNNQKKNKKLRNNANITFITRTKDAEYEKCIEWFKKFTRSGVINNFMIISNLRKKDSYINEIKLFNIYDKHPTIAKSLNLAIAKLEKIYSNNESEKNYFIIASKEVELQPENINALIENINSNENILVVGYEPKDNILSDKEYNTFSNQDGIAYQIPWNTCAIWNYNLFIKYIEKFDEICSDNQLGGLLVKIDNCIEETEYEGMEDGLAILKALNKNKKLKFILLKDELFWNIQGDGSRILKHKLKMARKNIVLSTFMNIKGYSIDKLREAGR